MRHVISSYLYNSGHELTTLVLITCPREAVQNRLQNKVIKHDIYTTDLYIFKAGGLMNVKCEMLRVSQDRSITRFTRSRDLKVQLALVGLKSPS